MFLTKEHLRTVECASTDPNRLGLTGLHITPDYVEATDGHLLVRKHVEKKFKEEDYPPIQGIGRGTEILMSCILDKNGIKKAMQMIKPNKHIPILSCAFLSEEDTNKNGKAVFAATDLETVQICQVKKIEAQYPTMDDAFPTDPDRYCVAVDPKILIQALAQFDGHIVIEVTNGYAPLLLRSAIPGTGTKTEALVMPMRFDKVHYDASWGAQEEAEEYDNDQTCRLRGSDLLAEAVS